MVKGRRQQTPYHACICACIDHHGLANAGLLQDIQLAWLLAQLQSIYGEAEDVLWTEILARERAGEAEQVQHPDPGRCSVVCCAVGLPDQWRAAQAVPGVPDE